MKTIADPRVKQFSDLISRGIEAWSQAGKLLCEIVRDNPAAYTQILSNNPHLTREILESFERIGRKQIYPYLLVDGSPGAQRLAGLAYADQVKLYRARVTVIIKTRSGLEERQKQVSELTKAEAALVFDVDRVRTAAEQLKLLRNGSGRHNVITNHRTDLPAKPDSSEGEAEALEGASLNENPKAELSRLLTIANSAMLEARTALSVLKRGSQKDLHITNALIEIGSLRYAVNEDEL